MPLGRARKLIDNLMAPFMADRISAHCVGQAGADQNHVSARPLQPQTIGGVARRERHLGDGQHRQRHPRYVLTRLGVNVAPRVGIGHGRSRNQRQDSCHHVAHGMEYKHVNQMRKDQQS